MTVKLFKEIAEKQVLLFEQIQRRLLGVDEGALLHEKYSPMRRRTPRTKTSTPATCPVFCRIIRARSAIINLPTFRATLKAPLEFSVRSVLDTLPTLSETQPDIWCVRGRFCGANSIDSKLDSQVFCEPTSIRSFENEGSTKPLTYRIERLTL